MKGVQPGVMVEAPFGMMERFIVVAGLMGLREVHSGGGGKAAWDGDGREDSLGCLAGGVGDKCMHCDNKVTVGETAIQSREVTWEGQSL